MAEDKRIFISYARKDGAELAQRLLTDLSDNGFKPWLDTGEIAGGDSWTDAIEGGIDGAEVVLALLTPGSYASRICRAEQLRALRKDKLVIPLMAKTASDIPLHLEPNNYRDFTGAVPYKKQFQILLKDLSEGGGGANLKAEYRSTYVTAPPLPLNFVPRPDEQQALRQFVMANADGVGVALTALEGMGGIGKTILAQSLCHDEAIQQAFPDGVLWVTAGQEPVHNLRDRINEVRSALNDHPVPTESELACINRYRSLLHDKAVLLVVDDVWRVADIEPFLVESARSCVLFTTRDTSIAASLGARECRAGLLTPEKSRELLARYSGVALGELPREAELVIEQCGGLPLALAMVGAMLRGKPQAYWQCALTLLHAADLGKIRAQFPNYRHADLLKCIQVSVNALEPGQLDRYLALAVLLEDMAAAPAVQQAVWNLDPGDALDTAEQFIGLSLAQREGEGIRLHDLQLDYVRAQFPDGEALGLIHGAIRLSAHVITRDPDQFASQMVGRLLPHRELAAVKQFVERIAQGASKPWLRPLQPTLHPPGTSLVCTLQGHTNWVNGVALSWDCRRAVSASWDRTLKVWDVETGREIRTLQGHTNRVTGVALSGDARLAVSSSDDGTLKVWDVETGRELRTFKGHTDSVHDVALSRDGRCAVSASADGTLRVWDVETGHELRTVPAHTRAVHGVALSDDRRRAVTASDDGTLKVWDVETGRELRTLKGHTSHVNSVALSGDGRRAVSASYDKTLKVWDVETGHELRALQGHTRAVNGVALSGERRRAVSASQDQTLKMWDVETGREVATLQSHTRAVNGVALSGDGRRAVSASEDRTLKVWDMETGHELHVLRSHKERVRGVALSWDGLCAVSASEDRTLKVWDVETGRELRTLQGHTDVVWRVALRRDGRRDGRRAVSASEDQTLKVWDVETGRELRTLQGHADSVKDVVLNGDGRCAVSASWDNTLKVWDLETGEITATFTCDGAAYCCAFVTDRFIAGDAGGHVHFLRLEEPKRRS